MQDQGRTDAGLSSHPIAACSCTQCVPQDRQHPAPSHAARLLIRAQTLSHSCPDMASTELFLLHCFLPVFFSPKNELCYEGSWAALPPDVLFVLCGSAEPRTLPWTHTCTTGRERDIMVMSIIHVGTNPLCWRMHPFLWEPFPFPTPG